MASQKISAMPAAAVTNNADVLPIVQAGLNKKATRDVLMTAASGEDIHLFGQTCTVSLAHSVQNIIASSIQFQIQCSGSADLYLTSAGGQLAIQHNNVYLESTGAFGIDIADGGGGIFFAGSGFAGITCGSTKNITLQYNGATQITVAQGGTTIAVTGTQTLSFGTAGGSLAIAASGLVTISLSLLVLNDVDVDRHLGSLGSTPSIAGGAGAGTGPTLSITGNDLHGSISIRIGTTPSTNSVVATITTVAHFANAPNVVLFPTNAAASQLTTAAPFVTSTINGWSLNSTSVALSAGATYTFNYIVLGT